MDSCLRGAHGRATPDRPATVCRAIPDAPPHQRRARTRTLAGLATLLLVALAVGSAVTGIRLSSATFTAQANLAGNTISASSDWVAPQIAAAVIASTSGSSAPGYVRQGDSYYVYAQASDTGGDPPSGVASVSADVANVTTGQTSVVLSTAGGPWTVDGTSYKYRSASLTADSSLDEGIKSYTVTATDNAANSTTSSFSVTVDNSAP